MLHLILHLYLLLMVICFVTERDALLLQFPAAFAVNLETGVGTCFSGVLLKDPSHMVQHTNDRTADCRSLEVIFVVEEILCILVSLLRRASEPFNSFFLVLLYVLTQKVQFAQCVLSELVTLFCGGGQVFQCLFDVLGNIFAGQVDLAEAISRVLIVLICRFAKPLHSFIYSLLRQKEFSERVF